MLAENGLIGYVVAGLVGGAALVGSASEASGPTLMEVSKLTPQLDTAVMTFVVAISAHLLRKHAPSAAQSNSQFESLSASHKTLGEKLVDFATQTRTSAHETSLETNKFRVEISEKLGRLDGSLRTFSESTGKALEVISGRQKHFEEVVDARLDVVEAKIDGAV